MRLASIFPIALCLYGAPIRAEVPTVMTDIPPIHSLVAQVMGDLGNPVLLLEPGGDAHDFQLRPSQASALADADAIFWIGPNLTPWLDRALAITPDAVSVPLLETPGTIYRTYDDSGHHAHTEQSGPDASPTEGPQGHSDIDPHAWLDPTNAEIWLGRIADELAVLDPGNSITYRANASLSQAAIAALDADLQLRLEATKTAPIIIAHDAMGYFAGHFGLSIAATVATGDAADPGAAHLSEIRDLLEKGGIACIFPEALGNPSRIAVLADGTDTRIGEALDPEGRILSPGPELYAELLSNLATAISACVAPR
ncbi:MAG: zinc ABC transporter substrate-binding protein [Albidovulum sp.]